MDLRRCVCVVIDCILSEPSDKDKNIPLPVGDSLDEALEREFETFNNHGPFSEANYFFEVVTKGLNKSIDGSSIRTPFSLREEFLGVNEVQMLLSLIDNARIENRWMTLTQKKEGFFASVDETTWSSKGGYANVLKAVMNEQLTTYMNKLKSECIRAPLFQHEIMGDLISLRGEVVIEEETNGYDQLEKLFNHKKRATKFYIWDAVFEKAKNETLATKLEFLQQKVTEKFGARSPIRVVDFLDLSIYKNDVTFDTNRVWKWIKKTFVTHEGIVAELMDLRPSDNTSRRRCKVKFKLFMNVPRAWHEKNCSFADTVDANHGGKNIDEVNEKYKLKLHDKSQKSDSAPQTKSGKRNVSFEQQLINQVHCYWGTTIVRFDSVVDLNNLYQKLNRKLGIPLDPDKAPSLRHDDFDSETVFPIPPLCTNCGKYLVNPSHPKPEDCQCAVCNPSSPTAGQGNKHQDYDPFEGMDELPSEDDNIDVGDGASSQTYESEVAKLVDNASKRLISEFSRRGDGNKDTMTEELQEIDEMSRELKEQVPPLLQELTELRAKRDEEIEVQGVPVECEALFKRLLLFAALQKPFIGEDYFLRKENEQKVITLNKLLLDMSTDLKKLILNNRYLREIWEDVFQDFQKSNNLDVIIPEYFESVFQEQITRLEDPHLRLDKNQ